LKQLPFLAILAFRLLLLVLGVVDVLLQQLNGEFKVEAFKQSLIIRDEQLFGGLAVDRIGNAKVLSRLIGV
jgi:hypothetical protein